MSVATMTAPLTRDPTCTGAAAMRRITSCPVRAFATMKSSSATSPRRARAKGRLSRGAGSPVAARRTSKPASNVGALTLMSCTEPTSSRRRAARLAAWMPWRSPTKMASGMLSTSAASSAARRSLRSWSWCCTMPLVARATIAWKSCLSCSEKLGAVFEPTWATATSAPSSTSGIPYRQRRRSSGTRGQHAAAPAVSETTWSGRRAAAMRPAKPSPMRRRTARSRARSSTPTAARRTSSSPSRSRTAPVSMAGVVSASTRSRRSSRSSRRRHSRAAAEIRSSARSVRSRASM